MSTTTPAAVRNAIAAVVKGLTPTAHTETPFREHEEREAFRDWCVANASACLRRYSVRWIGDTAPPTVSNTDVEFVERAIDVEVAYPTAWRLGGRQLAGLDDAISEDLRLIAHAVGTNGHARVAAELGAASVTITTEAERVVDLGPIHLGQVALIARYYRSNAT